MYKDRIVLGSGALYCVTYSGTIPEDTTIETDANLLGEISGGATLEYSITKYTAISDSGKIMAESTASVFITSLVLFATIEKWMSKRPLTSSR